MAVLTPQPFKGRFFVVEGSGPHPRPFLRCPNYGQRGKGAFPPLCAAFWRAGEGGRLEPYHSNVTQRLIKAPKLYFLDTGLAAYLTEWASPETLEAGAMSGPILETWIIAELLKSYGHTGRRPPFYYYRDKDQREIDLLLVQDGIVYPLELKKTASPGREDVQHFRALERLGLSVGPGDVICLAEQVLPLTATTQSIPVWAI